MSNRPRFYKQRPVQIAAAVVAIAVAALAWWLISPLFIDQVVDEPFPRAAMAVIPDDMTAEEVERKMMEAEAVDTPAYEDMPEPSVAPPTTTPGTTTTYASGTMDAEEEATEDEEAATTTTAAPPATEAAAEATAAPTTRPQDARPVALATGSLMDADSFHKGSGQVTLYRLEDGTHLIRMEDISVTNGPQLHVLLAPIPSVDSRDDLQSAGYIDLGGLKGNKGSQNYEVPPDYQIPEEMTLVIYCVPFHVVFATAPLA